jgi:molybdopterin molybdotransferase
MRMRSVDDVLAPLLAAVTPVAPTPWPLDRAEDLVTAADIVAPGPIPPASVALRSGLAVRALDLVGASAHSPVALPSQPTQVRAGDNLSSSCDAILDPAALSVSGGLIEAMDAVEPGAYVRIAGHDLEAGHVIVRKGEKLTIGAILASRLAGFHETQVRAPVCRLEWPHGPAGGWLFDQLRSLGVRKHVGEGDVQIAIAPCIDEVPRLALRPGEAASAGLAADGALELTLPTRFDAMVGAWCAVALPLLAKLMDQELAARPLPLSRKVTSTVGLTEIALLKTEGGVAHPLCIGDITLAAFAAADAFAVLPAASEGLAAGALIDVTSFGQPFRERGATA